MRTRFRALETPSNAAGPREPGAAQPRFALWRAWGRGRKRLALLSGSEAHWGCGLLPEECFTLQNAVPRSSFGAFGARGSHAERPSWLRGHGWGLGAEGLRAPNPASPRRRTRGEKVLAAEDTQQSSRAQGARGRPAPLCAMESVGRGRKRLALLSGSEAHWGCGLLPEECFPLQNAVLRSSFWAFGATGPRR